MGNRESKKFRVKMKYTQQMVLFGNLTRGGKFGHDDEEMIPNLFREYVGQTFGTGGL